MNLSELKEKFKDVSPDRTLVNNLEIEATIRNITNHWIILDDGTEQLEAVTSKQAIYEHLKNIATKKNIVRLKGRLDKTEFGNIAFSIQEILE